VPFQQGKNKANAKAKRDSRSLRDDKQKCKQQKRRRGVGLAEVNERGAGLAEVKVEKKPTTSPSATSEIYPLRCAQRREPLRSK